MKRLYPNASSESKYSATSVWYLAVIIGPPYKLHNTGSRYFLHCTFELIQTLRFFGRTAIWLYNSICSKFCVHPSCFSLGEQSHFTNFFIVPSFTSYPISIIGTKVRSRLDTPQTVNGRHPRSMQPSNVIVQEEIGFDNSPMGERCISEVISLSRIIVLTSIIWSPTTWKKARYKFFS